MSDSDYFFINHSKKQYCMFDNNESIIASIEIAIYKNAGWETTDDIRVESQLTDKTTLFDYLTGEGYKNCDWEDEGGPTDDSPEASDTESSNKMDDDDI